MPPERAPKREQDTAATPPTREAAKGSRPVSRLHIALMHGTRYAFNAPTRLAADVGCSRATIWRLIHGKTRPSFSLVQAVADAVSRDLGRPIEPRELFCSDGSGTFPTPSGCLLCGCSGCFPDEAWDSRGNLRPAFWNLRPGEWSVTPGPQDSASHNTH